MTILQVTGTILIGGATLCQASLVLDSMGSAGTIDFDTTRPDVNEGAFAGRGFAPGPSAGQLDSDSWSATGMSDAILGFGGEVPRGDLARGPSAGGVSTGGVYAFDVGSGNMAFGVQPTGSDWDPGTITLRVQNATGQMINDLVLAYTVYIRNDADRASSFNSSYSIDDLIYKDMTSLNLISPEIADTIPSFVPYHRLTTLHDLSLDDGEFCYLRWSGTDVDGSGSRDEFALDDISITPIPESAAWGVFPGFGLLGIFGLHVWRQGRNRSRTS